jgi:hypothetical protein
LEALTSLTTIKEERRRVFTPPVGDRPMIAAVFAPAMAGRQVSSKLETFFKLIVDAVVASRLRNAERELRRYDGFIQDLAHRHGHQPAHVSRAELLPFKL